MGFARATPAVAVLTLCLVGLAGVSVVAGAPPPKQLCDTCGSDLEGTAGPGTLDVHVDSAGDSRWVERVPLNESAADRYRDDPDPLERAVEDQDRLGHWRHVARDDATNRTIDVEDGTLVVTYAVEDAATSGVGDAWVFDYLYAGGTQDHYALEAERVTLHPPDGHRATNEPPNAALENGTVEWTGTDAGGDGAPTEKTHVTYAPDGSGVAGTLESWATTAVVFGPLVLDHAIPASVVPVAVLGIATVTTRSVGGRLSRRTVGRHVGERGRIALERLCDRLGRPLDGRTLVWFPVGAVLAAGAVVWFALGLSAALFHVPFAVAAALFLPIGYALERGDGWVRYALVAALAPVAAVVAFAPYSSPWVGPVGVGLLYLPAALSAGTVGFALSLVGRRVGTASSIR
ncbi:hypothetical protein ACFQGT_12320 [Natrialbaceae archaeon GCM10025810]|uniref:hypothetical protein n=1 Tax=Halovalidus salilacus TaxID=3075124 RepID=UPI00361168B3